MTGAEKRGVGVLLAAVLLFAVVVVPRVWEKGDRGDGRAEAAGVALGVPRAGEARDGEAGGTTGGTRGSGGAGGSAGGGGPAEPGGLVGSGGSGGSGGSVDSGKGPAGGGTSGDDKRDDRAIGAAFAAARAGDCLALFDTGAGWNTRIPQKVGCSGDAGLTRVSAVRTGWSACPTGDGLSYVVHRTAAGKQVLCLTRQYKAGYCVQAEKGKGGAGAGARAAMRLGAMTAVDCKAKHATAPYDTILHITGVHSPSPGRSAANCRRAGDDRTLYWAWQVDGGDTLLCTMVYGR